MKTKCCHSRHIHYVEQKAICVNPNCENYLCATSVRREHKTVRTTFAASAFVFSLLFSFDDFSKDNIIKLEVPHLVHQQKGWLPCNESLKKEMIRQQILCVPEVLAQINLESGHLNSFLFNRTNNMLGMRYPFKRPTTAIGIYLPETDSIILGNQPELKKYMKQENYAVYDNWKEAVTDYKYWQENNFKVNEKYLDFLGKVYAEDSLYTSKIKSMVSK